MLGFGFMRRINKSPLYMPPGYDLHEPDFNPPKESGVCVVLGTHPCWKDDMAVISASYADFDVCLVNEAVKLMQGKYLATCHPEKLDDWVHTHKELWGKKPRCFYKPKEGAEPQGKYKHNGWMMVLGSGSGMYDAFCMARIGYDRVILAGCPMDGGGGYALSETHGHAKGDTRMGLIDSKHPLMQTWHKQMRGMVDKFPDICGKIKSVSGFSREVFGGLV